MALSNTAAKRLSAIGRFVPLKTGFTRDKAGFMLPIVGSNFLHIRWKVSWIRILRSILP